MPTKTLAQKLYIRPGYTVALLHAPKGAADLLAPLPDEVKVVTNTKGPVDLVLCFVKNQAELEKSANEIANTLGDRAGESVIVWFAYPKIASKTTTDLTRDKGWKTLYDLGFEGVASVAIDSVWTALRFKRGLARGEEDAVAKQYAGDRATLRPLYDRLYSAILSLGSDVSISPRQTYVAFARRKQFVLLKPSADRLDVVLKLSKVPLSDRLISAPGVGSGTMTHRVPVKTEADIDFQLLGWIQDAYRGVN
jgi:predicted transport protein